MSGKAIANLPSPLRGIGRATMRDSVKLESVSSGDLIRALYARGFVTIPKDRFERQATGWFIEDTQSQGRKHAAGSKPEDDLVPAEPKLYNTAQRRRHEANCNSEMPEL